jgi:hypothetical protein
MKIHLIVSSHLRLDLPSGSFPQVSPPKLCTRLSSPPYVLHAPPISLYSILPSEQLWVRGRGNFHLLMNRISFFLSFLTIKSLLLLNPKKLVLTTNERCVGPCRFVYRPEISLPKFFSDVVNNKLIQNCMSKTPISCRLLLIFS